MTPHDDAPPLVDWMGPPPDVPYEQDLSLLTTEDEAPLRWKYSKAALRERLGVSGDEDV